MRFSARAALPRFLWCALMCAGCSTAPKPTPKAAQDLTVTSRDQQYALRNQGYSLLYKLMTDEKDVSKLLLIKKENSDVGNLIRDIAKAAGDAAHQLEAFEKADPHLHLKMQGLPSAELETRDSISKTRAKELITKGGEKFEVRILLTQSEALTYGAHLAAVLENRESEPNRKQFLAETSRQFAALHQRVIDLFHARWREPAKP